MMLSLLKPSDATPSGDSHTPVSSGPRCAVHLIPSFRECGRLPAITPTIPHIALARSRRGLVFIPLHEKLDHAEVELGVSADEPVCGHHVRSTVLATQATLLHHDIASGEIHGTVAHIRLRAVILPARSFRLIDAPGVQATVLDALH